MLVGLFFSRTVLPLRFIMSLQNAIVTKISQSEIRTVHMTGVITDQLIELRPMASWNRHCGDGAPVRADRDRLRLLATILGLFLAGGVVGAAAFNAMRYAAVFSVAAMLVAISAMH